MKKDTNSVKCPRCGSNYQKGKWCQCGYQDDAVFVSFEAYLFSMTIDELKVLCKMHGIKMDSWKWQLKEDIVFEMSENESLRKSMGYVKNVPDEKIVPPGMEGVPAENRETAYKLVESMKKTDKKLARKNGRR